MISNAKNNVFAWRLPRAGTCGVPEADVFFAAFDRMCEVLEQFADEIPADMRRQIEGACADFVAVNKKMGITRFCILDFRVHMDWIVERELDGFTEKEKGALYDMGLLDYRHLFNRMTSVYKDKEIVDVITRHRRTEALKLLDEACKRPEGPPKMVPSSKTDTDSWHLAVKRLLDGLSNAFPDTAVPAPLAEAAIHLEDAASETTFDTSGIYTRKNLAELLSKRDGIPISEAESRIRHWEENGRVTRADYWQILNAWDGSNFYDWVEERECKEVYEAVCQKWNEAINIGLIPLSEPKTEESITI